MAEQTASDAQAGRESTSYEEAREELVDVVRRLEAGGTTLEESLALWERGEQLAQVCQRWLGSDSTRSSRPTPTDGNDPGQFPDRVSRR